MPTARRTRTIEAPAQGLWQTIRDPHHLPRWWPRVSRMEDVTEEAFTQVLSAGAGRTVRADFTLAVRDDRARRVRWEQRLQGSPFARLLKSATTEISLRDLTEDVAGAVADNPEIGPADASAGRAASLDQAGRSGGEAATEVTIELTQTLRGFFARFGAFMVRRAAIRTIEEALDGLERIGR